MKTCLRQKCQKEFEPTKPKQKFCSAKCKTYYSREEKKEKELKFAAPNPIEKKIDALFEKLDNIVFVAPTEASYDGSRLPKGYAADEPLSFDRLKNEAANASTQPTYLSLLNGMAGILFADEKEEYEIKIRKATNLTDKQRDALLSNLKQMR